MTLTPLANARTKSNPNGCGCQGSMCSQYTRLKMCVWPSTTTGYPAVVIPGSRSGRTPGSRCGVIPVNREEMPDGGRSGVRSRPCCSEGCQPPGTAGTRPANSAGAPLLVPVKGLGAGCLARLEPEATLGSGISQAGGGSVISLRPTAFEKGPLRGGVVKVNPLFRLVIVALLPEDLVIGGRVQLQTVVDIVGLLNPGPGIPGRGGAVCQAGRARRKRNYPLVRPQLTVDALTADPGGPIDTQVGIARRRPCPPSSHSGQRTNGYCTGGRYRGDPATFHLRLPGG